MHKFNSTFRPIKNNIKNNININNIKTNISKKDESKDVYRIGSYEILLNQQIGIGGYSVVYAGRCILITLLY